MRRDWDFSAFTAVLDRIHPDYTIKLLEEPDEPTLHVCLNYSGELERSYRFSLNPYLAMEQPEIAADACKQDGDRMHKSDIERLVTVEMIGGPHDGGKTQVGRGCTAFAVSVIDDDGTVHFGAYKLDRSTGKFRYELILVDPPSSGRTPPPLDDDIPWTPDRRWQDDE